jgi:hypothetical protein
MANLDHAARRPGTPRPAGAPLVVAIVVAVSSALLVAAATRHGGAVSPDSATYASGAQNLAHGAGYLDFQGQPITDWPPGFSVLLAAAHLTGAAILTQPGGSGFSRSRRWSS